MEFKQVPQINKETGEFIRYSLIQKDPMTGNWLIPKDCIDLPVPEFNQYERPVLIDNQWVIKPDYRNVKVFNKQTKEQVNKQLGENLTENETLIEPPIIDYTKNPFYKQVRWNYQLNNWEIYDDENVARDLFNIERSNRLSQTDWLILRHQDELARGVQTTLTNEQYQELLNYRQALRDMPEQENFNVFNPNWPEKPNFLR